MTEQAWMGMMTEIVPDLRRVLKPHGSAVFVLQPNYKSIGSMRLWLWEFMVWIGRTWNLVQDAYWWNIATLPMAGATNRGLLRSSLKTMVWAGDPCCYRNQDAVLWEPSEAPRLKKLSDRARFRTSPSGITVAQHNMHLAAERRGGVTPYNVLPMANNSGKDSAGAFGHGAGTPAPLADWWVRYICPPGGVVLDPFAGSGTMPLAARAQGKGFIGIEKLPKYYQIAAARLGMQGEELAA